jgi:hypothetical protein
MKKQQVIVRAINKEGHWDSIDVLDLDEASFRAFVIEMLYRLGVVYAIREDLVEGEHIQLKENK